MYSLEYWNSRAAEWRGAGFRSPSREATVVRMREAGKACDYCVRFRVVRLSVECAS